MHSHILQICISIDCCSRVYRFLLWPQPPTAIAVGESNEDLSCSCRSHSHCSSNAQAGQPDCWVELCLF
jgi:hypothetical protein